MATSNKTLPSQQPNPSLQDVWMQGVKRFTESCDRALDLLFMVLAEVEENLE
jgi:hypothetical protein